MPDADIIADMAEICKDSTYPVLSFIGTNGTAPYTFTFKVNNDNNASLTTKRQESIYLFDVKTEKPGIFNYKLVKVN